MRGDLLQSTGPDSGPGVGMRTWEVEFLTSSQLSWWSEGYTWSSKDMHTTNFERIVRFKDLEVLQWPRSKEFFLFCVKLHPRPWCKYNKFQTCLPAFLLFFHFLSFLLFFLSCSLPPFFPSSLLPSSAPPPFFFGLHDLLWFPAPMSFSTSFYILKDSWITISRIRKWGCYYDEFSLQGFKYFESALPLLMLC